MLNWKFPESNTWCRLFGLSGTHLCIWFQEKTHWPGQQRHPARDGDDKWPRVPRQWASHHTPGRPVYTDNNASYPLQWESDVPEAIRDARTTRERPRGQWVPSQFWSHALWQRDIRGSCLNPVHRFYRCETLLCALVKLEKHVSSLFCCVEIQENDAFLLFCAKTHERQKKRPANGCARWLKLFNLIFLLTCCASNPSPPPAGKITEARRHRESINLRNSPFYFVLILRTAVAGAL